MAVNFVCRCGEDYSYPDSEAGTQGVCASCRSIIEVPMAIFIPGGPSPIEVPIAKAPKPQVRTIIQNGNGLERGRTTVIVLVAVALGTIGYLSALSIINNQHKIANKVPPAGKRPNFAEQVVISTSRVSIPAGSLAKLATASSAPPPNPKPLFDLSPAPTLAKPPEPPAEPKAMTPDQIVAKLEPSVAVIRGFEQTQGAGFVVAPGLVATNAHLIRRSLPNTIKVSFPAGPSGGQGPFTADVLYFDDDQNLAILKVTVPTPPIAIAADYALRRGDDVVYIGGPRINNRLMQNTVARGLLTVDIQVDDQDYFELSGPVAPNQSGAPVIDSRAKVVAILASRGPGEGVGLCIPAYHLAEAVDAARTPVRVAEAKQRHEITVRLSSMVVQNRSGITVDGRGDANLANFIRRTAPTTWMASVDAKMYCVDSHPAVVPVKDCFKRAKPFYAEGEKAFAASTIQFVGKIRDAGMRASCASFLDGAATWAPEADLKALKTRSIRAFGDAYVNLRVNARLGHQEAIARMWSDRAALPLGLLVPVPAVPKANGPNSAPARVAAAKRYDDEGNKAAAIAAYQAIINDFPNTPESGLAQARLAILNPKKQPPSNTNPGRPLPRG